MKLTLLLLVALFINILIKHQLPQYYNPSFSIYFKIFSISNLKFEKLEHETNTALAVGVVGSSSVNRSPSY